MNGMYFLELNDGSLYTIENPPIQVDTTFQGQKAKGIEFTLTDTNLGQNQVKKIFSDEMAMANVRVRCSDKSLACEYTNFTNLKRISIDDETNQYTVTMAESSDLPSIVTTLQETVKALEGKLSDHTAQIDDQLRSQSENLDQALRDANNALDVRFENQSRSLNSELQTIHDGLNNFGDSILGSVDSKISETLNVEVENKMNAQREAITEELQTLQNGLNNFGVNLLGSVDEKLSEQQKNAATANSRLLIDVNDRIRNALNPSINIDEMELDELKEYKIAQSKKNLAEYLETHPITSSAHKGVTNQYSITAEKQQYLAQMIMLAEGHERLETAAAESEESVEIPKFKISWNAVGEPCTYDWTLQELYQLSIEIEAAVRPLISKQQNMEAQISSAVRRDTVLGIDVNFE